MSGDGSGSGSISSGFFMKTDEVEGRCIGGGVELSLDTNTNPDDPENDELRTIFYFPRNGQQSTRAEVVYNISNGTWSLLHLPRDRASAQTDPVWDLVNKAGITAPGGECELSDAIFALDIIERLSDLAFEHAND
jgi:hypothetical protein